MDAYIGVCYLDRDRQAAETLCAELRKYGFRFRCMSDRGDFLTDNHSPSSLSNGSAPVSRSAKDKEKVIRFISGATCIVALTSDAGPSDTSESDGMTAGDGPWNTVFALRTARDFGIPSLCVSTGQDVSDRLRQYTEYDELNDFNTVDLMFCVGEHPVSDRIPLPHDMSDETEYRDFIDRLFISRLCRYPDLFVERLCVNDRAGYGRLIKTCNSAAEGNASAAMAISYAYRPGGILTPSPSSGFKWAQIAKDTPGAPDDALLELGLDYLNGNGTEQNPVKALECFHELAKTGNATGNFWMGVCYLGGHGTMQDTERAEQCLLAAHQKGYPAAGIMLGCLYLPLESVSDLAEYPWQHDVLAARKPSPDLRLAVSYLYQSVRAFRADAQNRPDGQSPTDRDDGLLRHILCIIRRAPVKRLAVSCKSMSETRARLGLSPFSVSNGRPARPKLSPPVVMSETDFESMRKAGFGPDHWSVQTALLLLGIAQVQMTPDGRPSNCVRAIRFYRLASSMGQPQAEYLLGKYRIAGLGCLSDPPSGFQCFIRAATAGVTVAGYAVGMSRQWGVGCPRDATAAVNAYRAAAESGYAPAYYRVGDCLLDGTGVIQNPPEAVRMYRAAAKAGNLTGRLRLAVCGEYGIGTEANPSKAKDAYAALASEGYAPALFELARCYDFGIAVEKSRSNAYRYYKLAAGAGIADAEYAAGLCEKEGYGTLPDSNEYYRRMVRAAELGHIPAIWELGMCYVNGVVSVPDIPSAIRCFLRGKRLWECQEHRIYDRPLGFPERVSSLGMSKSQAVAHILYMLGYFSLYHTSVASEDTGLPSGPAAARALFAQAGKCGYAPAFTALADLETYSADDGPEGTPDRAALIPDTAVELYKRAVATSPKAKADQKAVIDPALSLARYYFARGVASQCDLPQLSISCDDLAPSALYAGTDDGDITVNDDVGPAEKGNLSPDTVSPDMSFDETGYTYLKKARAVGSADACLLMAKCHYYGIGTPVKAGSVMPLLQSADTLRGGHRGALLAMSDMYLTHDGSVCDYSPSDAIAVCERARLCRSVPSEYGDFSISRRRDAHVSAENGLLGETLYRLAYLKATLPVESRAEPRTPETAPLPSREPETGNEDEALSDLQNRPAQTEDFSNTEIVYLLASAALEGNGPAIRDLMRMSAGFVLLSKDVRTDIRKPDFSCLPCLDAIPDCREFYAGTHFTLTPFHNNFSAVLSEPDGSRMPDPGDARIESEVYAYLGMFFLSLSRDRKDSACQKQAIDCWERSIDLAVKKSVTRSYVLPLAQYCYGYCRMTGLGAGQDVELGTKWLKIASKTYAPAAYCVAQCCETGIGYFQKSQVEAMKYYRLSARLGYQPGLISAENIRRLLQSMLHRK